MKKPFLAYAALASCIAMPLGLKAATASHADAPATSVASATSATSDSRTTEGEIRKVDRNTRKVTIRHAELKHLDMPAMTMVFLVNNPSLLDKIKQGDKVDFVAEKTDGRFIVTHIEAKR